MKRGRTNGSSSGSVGRARPSSELLGLLLALVVWPCLAVGDESRKPPETWHATAYVRGSIGIRVIDYWSQGPDMVARTLINGHPLTTLVHGGRYVVYDGLTGRGLDIGRSPRSIGEDVGRPRPFAFELDELIRDGGEKIDEVDLGSAKGEIWQIRDTLGRRKLWTSVGVPQVPMRIQTFDRASGETIDVDYQNWIFDLELSPRFFEPAAGLDLERLEYDAYLQRSLEGSVGTVPILYPDLLHGNPSR